MAIKEKSLPDGGKEWVCSICDTLVARVHSTATPEQIKEATSALFCPRTAEHYRDNHQSEIKIRSSKPQEN